MRDRYGEVTLDNGKERVIDRFLREVQFGRVKFTERDAEVENPMENKFLNWVDKQKNVRASELKKVIELAAGPPLRSKFTDLLVPGRLPKGKPNYVPKNPKPRKVSINDYDSLTAAEVEEALKDYLVKKHPIRFKRR